MRPIELGDREFIQERLRSDPPQVSEHTFANMFCWRGHRPTFWTELSVGALIFLVREDRYLALMGPPVGDFDAAAAVEELAARGVSRLERLPGETARAFEASGLDARADRDHFDYVYRRSDLAELSGRRYHAKKNMVNQCLESYDCKYRELTADLLPEVAAMQERWCAKRDCGRDPGLCAEFSAIQEALQNFEALALSGAAVLIDGRVEAFTIGEELSPDTAVVHFEKAMTDFHGLYQLINMWFCERGLADFKYVNREQDLGVPGLRKAKESYLPHHMVEKHTISLTPEGVTEPVPAGARGRCADHDSGGGDAG